MVDESKLSEKELALLSKIRTEGEISMGTLSPSEVGALGKLTEFIEVYKDHTLKQKMVRVKKVEENV